MALIKCVECGKEISDKAKTCPNCGYAYKQEIKMTKTDKIFIPIITITIFLGIFGLCYSPSLIEYSYPDFQVKKSYDSNGLVGYDRNGKEIRGGTTNNHYDFGEIKVDKTKSTIVILTSILIPSITIFTYVVFKKKKYCITNDKK